MPPQTARIFPNSQSSLKSRRLLTPIREDPPESGRALSTFRGGDGERRLATSRRPSASEYAVSLPDSASRRTRSTFGNGSELARKPWESPAVLALASQVGVDSGVLPMIVEVRSRKKSWRSNRPFLSSESSGGALRRHLLRALRVIFAGRVAAAGGGEGC